MTTPAQRHFADLIDQVIGIDSRVGAHTEKWPYTDDFAIRRLKLGASLTILTDIHGNVLRYTLHHIGHPYKIKRDLGQRILAEVSLFKCWSKTSIGKFSLEGATLDLYQFAEVEVNDFTSKISHDNKP